jgi:hypothetical protein
MGDPFVRIVHPCKIYNMLVLPTTIIYMGPLPSHVGDLFEEANCPAMCRHVRLGDVPMTVRHLRELASDPLPRPDSFASVAPHYHSDGMLRRYEETITSCVRPRAHPMIATSRHL